MASVVVTMSGDEARLWKAQQKVFEQQRKLEEGYDKVGKASKESERKSREAAKARAAAEKEHNREMARGKALTESLRTPQERYNAAMEEANRLKSKGAISADTLARREKQLKKQLEENTGEVERQDTLLGSSVAKIGQYATAAAAVGAAVQMIRKAWQTVIEEQEKGLEALKKNEDTGRALLQISDSPEQFQELRKQSQQLSSQFGVDIQTVERVMFSAVSEGFRDSVPELIKASQVIAPESAAGVAGQVPALFKGDVNPLEAVDLTLKAARDSRLNFEEIARSLPSAAEGGSVAGASTEETLAVLSTLASRFKSGDTAADRIKAFATRVGIDEGGLSDEEFAKKQEAERKRVATAEKQFRAKQERVADLELKLETSATAKTRPQIERDLARARRDVAEFDQSRLQEKEIQRGRGSLAGQGIIGAVEALQKLPESELKDFLGDSQELNVAFKVLTEELDTIKARVADIKQEREQFSQGGGILRDRIGTAQGDAQLTAIRENNIATQKLEQAYREGRGVEGATADAAVKNLEAGRINNAGLATRTIEGTLGVGSKTARIGAALGFNEEQATQAGQNATNIVTGGIGGATQFDLLTQTAALMFKASQTQAKASEQFEKATKRRPQQSVVPAARAQVSGGGT